MWRYTGIACLCLLSLQRVYAAAPDGYEPCAGSPVAVAATETRSRETVCAAADQALRFLESYGLRPTGIIRVRVVELPQSMEGHPIYGHYNSRTDRIEVMSREAILRRVESATVYGQAVDADLYRSVIAHEVAHAVTQQNRQVESLTGTAQEYLAHATQLGVLPDAHRARIIAAAGVGPWEAGDVISDVYQAMAPARFAVKCYLHLTTHADPQGFVQHLLSSQWRYINVD